MPARCSRALGAFAVILFAIEATRPRTSRAASPPPTAIELGLEEARRRASARAPDVILAQRRVREAEATRVGAGIPFPENPRATIDVRPGLDRASRGELGYASSLDLMFEVGGGPGARRREADARVRLAQADGEVVRLEAALRGVGAFVSVRLSDLAIEQMREAIAAGERVLGAAQERRQAGAGSDIDVTSARMELAELRAQRHAAEADRHFLEMELRTVLDLPAEAPLRLITAIDRPAPLPALDTLLARARQGRPELAAIRARLALNAAAEERLRKEARPRLGAFAGVDASPQSPLFGVAGLSVELPFFQRNQGPRAVVAAERQTELERLTIETTRVDRVLRAAHRAHEAHLAELRVLADEGIPAAEARRQMVEEGWRAGKFDIFKLVTATQDLVRLKAMRLEVLDRVWQERTFIERLTGGFPDAGS